MLSKRQKIVATSKVRRHDSDTGSAESQVALLTKRITELSSHLKKNAKDLHSRRGLLQLVAKKRKHLKYLQNTNEGAYKKLVKN